MVQVSAASSKLSMNFRQKFLSLSQKFLFETIHVSKKHFRERDGVDIVFPRPQVKNLV